MPSPKFSEVAMDSDDPVVGHYFFQEVEYVISVWPQEETLTIEIEDKVTADQWRASFDPACELIKFFPVIPNSICLPFSVSWSPHWSFSPISSDIEDLTHKTGNFKQFSVFVSMLISAVNQVGTLLKYLSFGQWNERIVSCIACSFCPQSSESVSLDLLTYSDLEVLRTKKAGVTSRSYPTAPTSNGLNSKRYLILTYTVEFDRSVTCRITTMEPMKCTSIWKVTTTIDSQSWLIYFICRIHYPLPLPYVGKPDPTALQETIRQLREEISSLKCMVWWSHFMETFLFVMIMQQWFTDCLSFQNNKKGIHREYNKLQQE